MHLKLLSLIVLAILFGCVNKTKTTESNNKTGDTLIQNPVVDMEDAEDTLTLDTIKYNQVLLNSLPLQIDTFTAIKTLGKPYSRNIYALGTCYRFGDATLWDLTVVGTMFIKIVYIFMNCTLTLPITTSILKSNFLN